MAANTEAVKIGGFGLVLVFDLDNTLIDTNDMESMKANEQLIKDALNRNIIYNVLRTAENFRTAYPGSIDAILLLTNNDDSVFNKTVIINNNEILKIYQSFKPTSKLEDIQNLALKIGLKVFAGSTKDGKPKNKTKSELLEDIKNYLDKK